MKRIIITIYVLILFTLSCRERNNIYDIGSDDFTPPPAIAYIAPQGIYNSQGFLIGINFLFYFEEPFEKTLPLHHELYQEDSLLRTFDLTINQGDSTYVHEIYDNFVIAAYSLKVFFGDFPIGSTVFRVDTIPGWPSYIAQIDRQ